MTKTKFKCWWYGHERHEQDYNPDAATCMYCGEYVPYGDMVGDTRHNNFMRWFRYWFWRKWMPEKCIACGSRFGHRKDCDGLPF